MRVLLGIVLCIAITCFPVFVQADSIVLQVIVAATSSEPVIPPEEPAPEPTPTGGTPQYATRTETRVSFSGLAYPGASIELFENNVSIAKSRAEDDGSFEVTVSNIEGGTHVFNLEAADSNFRYSHLESFALYVTPELHTTVSGIFLSPTLKVSESEIKKGDVLKISGYTIPHAAVSLYLNNQIISGHTTSNSEGLWAYDLATSDIPLGLFGLKVRATRGSLSSSYSDTVSFVVGTKSTSDSNLTFYLPGDYNKDGRVNLTDFSLASPWHKKTSTPAYLDITSDGRVDLVDFSIIAFYWTG